MDSYQTGRVYVRKKFSQSFNSSVSVWSCHPMASVVPLYNCHCGSIKMCHPSVISVFFSHEHFCLRLCAG